MRENHPSPLRLFGIDLNFFNEMLHSMDGVISIGPFACMPTRVIEAVLSAESSMETKKRLDPVRAKHIASLNGDITKLPFLSIETDGNPFPQILEARIEAFCLQVERLHGQPLGLGVFAAILMQGLLKA